MKNRRSQTQVWAEHLTNILYTETLRAKHLIRNDCQELNFFGVFALPPLAHVLDL